jgi:dTMP kinase
VGNIPEKPTNIKGKHTRGWEQPLQLTPVFVTLINKYIATRSMLLTFEGLDSSGKSTQAQLLVDRLNSNGYKTLLIREPGGTPLSEHLRTILLDRQHLAITPTSEFFMFSASRAQLVESVIRPALTNGTIVVCDRFYDSSTAYQGWGRGLPLEEIKRINRVATGGLVPDRTIILDIPIEEILSRKIAAGYGSDRIENAGSIFYQKVREGYHAIAREEPARVILMNGLRTIEEIQTEIWHCIQQLKGL